jgi:hypothetical protein
MKNVLLSIIGIVMIGGLSACSSLPGFLGGTSNQINAVLAAAAAGKYEVLFTKNGMLLYSEAWECTQAEGKLTGCHKVEGAAPSSPLVK